MAASVENAGGQPQMENGKDEAEFTDSTATKDQSNDHPTPEQQADEEPKKSKPSFLTRLGDKLGLNVGLVLMMMKYESTIVLV